MRDEKGAEMWWESSLEKKTPFDLGKIIAPRSSF